ncbi:riboflavin biosynthesis protein RibF [Facklamia miroungae]|uniref:Riboflavin biosynthesis protein n=1 Tax=Facklamia miroungae TaxID=120956 RepID=A0A1G7P4B8_9LACT|nr:riboflavin biosynthesis protein RibF [Facklamia miroungae]NKZ28577.1 riboflavin biosynthesis protein RibF [Facklamia miroungae]SDF81156.1 riboflavin kinase / FMN adenylyltransferase [Facklamia miroungae]
MQTIYLSHPYDPKKIYDQPIVLALGFFDGVHLGHQEVIKKGRELADYYQVSLAVLTFNHTPRLVYQLIHPKHYHYLSDNARKIELMEANGVDVLYIAEFTSAMGAQSPQEFVDNYMVNLNAIHVVAGFDYTYGPKENANMQTLKAHSQGRFAINEIPKKSLNDHKISSSEIHSQILKGNMEVANQELGYIYQTSGIVINGLKRGRKLGFPTANVAIDDGQLIPAIGVYVVEFFVQDQWHYGMASIGYNITFDDVKELSVEVYILDFNQMIYGERVKIKWHHYLRGEIKFDGIEPLIQQLELDQAHTRAYFELG